VLFRSKRHMAKFFHDGKTFATLEDHSGILADFPHEGPSTPHVRSMIDRLMRGSYLHVKSKQEDEKPGDTPKEPTAADHDLPENDPIDPPRASVWDYHRVGMDTPQTLEVVKGKPMLNGNPLSREESQLIFSNVQNGRATLRHRKPLNPNPFLKSEGFVSSLMKADGAKGTGLADSLEHIRGLVSAGHLPQEHYDRIRRELYEDEMIPGMGNRRAHTDHLANEAQRGGVHINLDVDNLKSINDTYGHAAGDAAITGAGKAMQAAIAKSGGSDVLKAHHISGDEFHLHAPTPEHAHQFMRNLRAELEAHPPIGGTHKLAMSAGMGLTHQEADKAMYGAKEMKSQVIRSMGGDPTDRMSPVRSPHHLHAFSSLPGASGPIPMQEPSPMHALQGQRASEALSTPPAVSTQSAGNTQAPAQGQKPSGPDLKA